MFISTTDYLQRITHALENVIAPQVESTHLRGQILAAVFLLEQLTDRIDYKGEVIADEIEGACTTTKKVVDIVAEKTGEKPPEELWAFLVEVDEQGRPATLAFRERSNEMLSSAIDFFFDHRKGLDDETIHQVEEVLLAHLTGIAGRDLGMFKPSTSEKILDLARQ